MPVLRRDKEAETNNTRLIERYFTNLGEMGEIHSTEDGAGAHLLIGASAGFFFLFVCNFQSKGGVSEQALTDGEAPRPTSSPFNTSGDIWTFECSSCPELCHPSGRLVELLHPLGVGGRGGMEKLQFLSEV